MKTSIIDLSGGNSHIREIAEESGADYLEYHSCEKTENGVESWYDEEKCKWYAFIMGVGTASSWESRESAVAEIVGRENGN